MTRKLFFLTVGLLSLFFVHSNAYAQRVELIFDSDQLMKGGREALQAGNYERAVYYFEEALKRHNLSQLDLVQVHSDLCVAYIYVDRLEDAVGQCKTSIGLQSNRWQTYNNLGTVYLVMGDYANAIDVYEKALKMKPGSEILQFNLEIAKEKLAAGSGTQNLGDGENDENPASSLEKVTETIGN